MDAPDAQFYWWGVLRRRPVGGEASASALSAMPAALALGTGLALAWTLLLTLPSAAAALESGISPLAARIVIPAAVGLLPAVLLRLLPRSGVEKLTIPALSWLVREKGLMGPYDLPVGLAVAALAIVAYIRTPAAPHSIPLAITGVLACVTGFLFWASAPAPFLPRDWLPEADWLEWLGPDDAKAREERDQRASTGELFEVGAKPIHAFRCLGPQGTARETFRIGVRIDPVMLAKLREFNRAAEGQLFHERIRAVVLSEGAPAAALGLETVDRLCWQILEAGRRAGLTRYMLASSILLLVQEVVRYEHDEPSTKRIFGDVGFPEYGRFPAETLHDLEGDCDCTSILCAALLARCRIPCALVWMTTGPDEGHMAVGLEMNEETIPGDTALAAGRGVIQGADGGKMYLYGETATDDASSMLGFGVVPSELRGKVKVDRVEAIPTA